MVDERGRSVAEIAGDLLFERRQAVGDAAAERRGHPTGSEAIPRRAEREAFWTSFITPETEQRMLAEGMATGADPTQVRRAIAGIKYKRRWELWEQQGDLPARIAWAKAMVKLGPPGEETTVVPPEAAEPTAEPARPSAGSALLDTAPGPAASALMGAQGGVTTPLDESRGF